MIRPGWMRRVIAVVLWVGVLSAWFLTLGTGWALIPLVLAFTVLPLSAMWATENG